MNLIDIRPIFKFSSTILILSCIGLLFSASNVNAFPSFASCEDVLFTNPNIEQSELQEEITIKIPELVTPNGDGKNDSWEIVGIENFKNTKVMIFNRWGNKVYEMEQYDNSWNGMANKSFVVGGAKLPAGTYYFIVEIDDKIHKGFLFLAR